MTVERLSKEETNQALVVLREESKCVLISERTVWAKGWEAFLKEVDDLRQKAIHNDDEDIMELQQLTDRNLSEVSALREEHKKLLEEEFYVGCLTGYAW